MPAPLIVNLLAPLTITQLLHASTYKGQFTVSAGMAEGARILPPKLRNRSPMMSCSAKSS